MFLLRMILVNAVMPSVFSLVILSILIVLTVSFLFFVNMLFCMMLWWTILLCVLCAACRLCLFASFVAVMVNRWLLPGFCGCFGFFRCRCLYLFGFWQLIFFPVHLPGFHFILCGWLLWIVAVFIFFIIKFIIHDQILLLSLFCVWLFYQATFFLYGMKV